MPPRADSAPMAGLSAAELMVYKAVSDTEHLSQREIERQCPDFPLAQLQEAMNGLLRKNLIKLSREGGRGGKPVFKQVRAKEARIMGAMAGDEAIVYQHISLVGNEGIWTKTLKAKTNLHMTVMNRCLKALEQRQLVKAVKNVKYPTRKTYMLFGLKPSVELTGGPWFNDNELDVGFIEGLLQAVYTFIEKKTFIGDAYQVWPTSRTDKYPSLSDIRRFIHTSGLTEVKLEEEHVQSLLEVLVFDGKVESLPGAGGWRGEDSEEEGSRERERERDRRRKRKRVVSESESEEDRRRRKKRSKRRERSDDEDSEEEGEGSDASRGRSGSKKRKRSSRSDDSEDDSEPDGRKSRKKRRASRSPSRSRSRSRSDSPAFNYDINFTSPSSFSSSVYRALRRESYASGLTEVPCGLCEVFDFCAPKGPVNARDCTYYDEWLLPDVPRRVDKGKGRVGRVGDVDGPEEERDGDGDGEGEGEGEGTWDEEDGEGGGMEIGYEAEQPFEEEY